VVGATPSEGGQEQSPFAVFDESLDAVTVLRAVRDGNGAFIEFRVAYANPVAAYEAGCNMVDVVGERAEEYYPEAFHGFLHTTFLQILETGRTIEFPAAEFSGKGDGSGPSGWYRFHASKFGDHVIVTYRDITAEHKAEQQRAAERAEARLLQEALLPPVPPVSHGLEMATLYLPASDAALAMELRNADGSVAEMSGNGIRCFVQAAVGAGLVPPGRVTVATAAGVRTVVIRPGAEPGLAFAEVDMGPALLGAAVDVDGVPGARSARLVDVGNPHVVVLGAPVDDATVADAGARLETSHPDGANVEFAWPGPDPDSLTVRVWERGVGETLACGTGACAVAAAARSWGVVANHVRVHSDGGTLDVELSDGGVRLSGPTRFVGTVVVDEAVLGAMVDERQVADLEQDDQMAARP